MVVNEKIVLKKFYRLLPILTTRSLYTASATLPLLRLGYRKRNVIRLIFISCCLFLTTRSSAQFCQTWSLNGSPAQTANSGASTTGNTELIGSGMSAVAYNGAYQSFPKPGGVNWPSVVNTASGIYLEFPVTPAAGNNLVINSITFSAFEN